MPCRGHETLKIGNEQLSVLHYVTDCRSVTRTAMP